MVIDSRYFLALLPQACQNNELDLEREESRVNLLVVFWCHPVTFVLDTLPTRPVTELGEVKLASLSLRGEDGNAADLQDSLHSPCIVPAILVYH